MTVNVRPFDPDRPDDIAFIADSWIRSYLNTRRYDKDSYEIAAMSLREYIKWALSSFEVAVAETDDGGDLVGWIAYDSENAVLVYVYVKLKYRKNGYATTMVNDLVRGSFEGKLHACFQTPAMFWMGPKWGAIVDEWDSLDRFFFASQEG